MNIKVDASGLDEFIEEIENEVSTAMINAAHSAVDTQKTSNISNKKHIKSYMELAECSGSCRLSEWEDCRYVCTG